MRTPFLLSVALLLASAGQGAAAQAVESASVERVGADRLKLSWKATAPVDLYVGADPSAAPSKMRLVSDDDPDGRHELQLVGDERPYFLLRPAAGGAGVRVAERLLPLEGGSNFRDVGGYPAADGRRVRWGRIYRTGAMPKLTDRDYDYLSKLGIEVVCDLRSTEERQLSPTKAEAMGDARYVAFDYPASDVFRNLTSQSTARDAPSQSGRVRSMYREWPVSLARQYKAIFDNLLAGDAPLAYHCSAGQDRTGVATALVLTALGVPRDVIYADYHLSTSLRRPEFEFADADLETLARTNIVARYQLEARKRSPEARRPQPLLNEAGAPRLVETFAEIEARWGTVENYLDTVLGVDAGDVARLRTMYLEQEPHS